MKKFKIILVLLITFSLSTSIYAIDNFSKTNEVDDFKVIQYIENKRIDTNGDIFCINRDRVEYYVNFFDDERDYPLTSYYTQIGKNTKTNDILLENVKQPALDSIEVMYEHNPFIYDNPVSKNIKSSKWNKAKIQYDSDTGKWKLYNISNSDYVFFNPSDSWRGEITIYIRATDDTGILDFNKTATNFTTFRVHKAPIPKFSFTEDSTTATLADTGSYDIDYQYRKNSRKNHENDREYSGIKEFYWSVKIGGNWVDVGTGPSVTFNKNGQAVTDYRLTVEDYDGAFTSISKNSLILEKPIADFNYTVGDKYTSYTYQGNVAHETTNVQSEITWNDEAYTSSLYSTSGTRTEKYTAYTALKTSETKNTAAAYNQLLNSKFNQLISSKKIDTKLEVKNRYDMADSVEKTLSIKEIDVVDKGGSSTKDIVFEDTTIDNADFTYTNTEQLTPAFSDYVGEKAFTVEKDINYEINLKTGNPEELKIKLKNGNNEIWLNREGNKYQGLILDENIPWSNSSTWDKLEYDIEVYSNRTNELLHRYNYSVLIHTPVPVTGSVSEEEILTDQVFTLNVESTKYSKTVEVQFPVSVMKVTGTNVDGTLVGTTYAPNVKIPLSRKDSENWSEQFCIPSSSVSEDTEITAKLFSTSYNNRDADYNIVTFDVQTIQLYDLTMFFTADVNWKNYYFDSNNNFKSNTEIKTYNMPVNKNYITNNAPEGIKAGYNTYFFLKSKGNPSNVILNKVTFKNNNISESELNKTFVRITDENKNIFGFPNYIINNLINTIDVNEQLWYLEYNIPLETYKGAEITFFIDAYKAQNKYNYNEITSDIYRTGVEKGTVLYINGNLNEDNETKTSH